MTQSIAYPPSDRSDRPSMIRRIAAHLYRSTTGVLIVTTAATFAVRMVSTVFLTRLLSPATFGVVGIISSIFFFIAMITDLGFQAFVVRHKDGDETHFRNVVWTIHVWRGVLIAAAAILIAPLVGAALQKPEVSWPLAVASLSLLFGGLSSLSPITVLRHNGAKLLSVLDLGMTTFQTVLSIILAFWWHNVWAIIAGIVAQSVVRTILSYTLFPDARHRFAVDKALAAEFWRFSRIILASSAISLVLAQTDKLVLARIFTLADFGLYAVATSLAVVPTLFVGTYASRVLYPIYARVWHANPGDLPRVFYAVRWRVSCLYAFAAGGLIGAAPFIIRLLYDPRYLQAATYLAILALSSAIMMTTRPIGDLLTATDQVSATLKTNIARLVWLILGGLAGYVLIGPVGVIWAVGTIEVPALLYGWYRLRRIGILSPWREGVQLALVGAGAGCGALLTVAVRMIFPSF